MRTFEQHEFPKDWLEKLAVELEDELAGIRATADQQDYADTNTVLIKERVERRKRMQEREEERPIEETPASVFTPVSET